MPHHTDFPSLWWDDGETLNFRAINEIPNVENRVDDVVACIRGNARVKKVDINAALCVEGRVNRKKLYSAVLLHVNTDEITVNPCYRDPDLHYWLARSLREMNIKKLRINYFNWNQSEANIILQALQVNRTLKEILFGCTDHPSSSIILKAVTETLPFQSSLTSLELYASSPTSVIQMSRPVLSALVRNRTVTKLKLTAHFGSREDLEVMEQGVTRVLQENPTLQSLTLEHYFHADPIDVGPILHQLNGNKSLNSLTLKTFRIGARNYTLVNDTVTTVKLSECQFNIEGAKSIGRAFSGLTALECLDIPRCTVDDTMVGHICKVLEESESLNALRMSGNNIGDDGCIHVCKALKQNGVLKTLDISWNRRITDSGAKALIETVKVNSALTTIYVSGLPRTSDAVKAELQYYLDLNKGPKSLLNARVPLPLSLWPQAFKHANDFRFRRSDDGNVRVKAPDMLYYLIKERVDLFDGVQVRRGRKRSRGA